MKTFPERLKEIRQGKGISARDLADKAGMRQSKIQSFECCKSQPKLDELKAICRALKVSADQLLGLQEFA